MTGWRRDLAAAAAVEAAAGFAAAAWVNAAGEAQDMWMVFAACTVAAAASDMVLVPGVVWRRGSPMAMTLLGRFAAALGTMVAAVIAGVWAAITLFGVVVPALSIALSSVVVPALSMTGVRVDGLAVVVGASILVAGAVAGLGAALADAANARPGIVRARVRSHVMGGVAGAALVSALSLVAAAGGTPSAPWRPLLVLAPITLMLGGGLRHAMMARDAVRTATALAGPAPLMARTLACCAVCTALGVAAMLAPALPPH